jgi:hypothetical protein
LKHKLPQGLPWLALAAFIASILLFVLFSGFAGIPDEDAAILYSYSRNLADTGVISYFTGGGRVEGATDFGWMISIAALQKLGLSNHFASSVLSTLFLSIFGYRLLTIKRSLGISSAARGNLLISYSVFLGVIFFSGASISGLGGFSTLAQAALLATIYSSCLFGIYDSLFLGSSIYFVLLRPDSILYYSVIVAAFMLCNYIASAWNFRYLSAMSSSISPKENSIRSGDSWPHLVRITFAPIAIFAAYWVFRGIYFGNLFPLPYYVKQSQGSGIGDTVRRFANELLSNRYNSLSMSITLLVALLACVLGYVSFGNKEDVRGSFATSLTGGDLLSSRDVRSPDSMGIWLVGLIAWMCFYLFQSVYLSRFNLIQNVWDRFHVPLLAVSSALLSCFLLAYSDRLPVKGRRSNASVLLVALLGFLLVNVTTGLRSAAGGYKEYLVSPYINNIYPLSVQLSKVHNDHPASKMFVTEAGRLSYYSRIPTVDTWGLNTPEYASAPLQDPSEVAEKKPDIINMHVDFSRLSLQKVDVGSLAVGRSCINSGDASDNGYCGWHQMNQAIFDGARELDYEMYLVPFSKGAAIHDRHDLFMINPYSEAADKLRKTLLSNGAIRVSDPRAIKSYRW